MEEAVEAALATEGSPVVVSDSGDNPTAGATEDLAIVDEHLRERGVEDALVAVVADPGALADCRAAGEGATVELDLGRTAHEPDAPPLDLVATVETLGSMGGVDAAVVESEGVRTVVTGERTSVYDPDELRAVGEEPADYDLVVVKSGYQSPAYQALAARSLLALTPGDTNCVLADLPYERVPRPVYPLDEFEWSP
ncbi:MAG: MlrC C-terminal domain-containing protein [Halobacteriaceae archaeon]